MMDPSGEFARLRAERARQWEAVFRFALKVLREGAAERPVPRTDNSGSPE